jgi:hypothetical protein
MLHHSSASPETLARYARAARGASARLEAEGRILEASLATFYLTCTEYRVLSAAGLDARLLVAARGAGELGAWVDEVAAQFRAADAAHFPRRDLNALTLTATIVALRVEDEGYASIGFAPKPYRGVISPPRPRTPYTLIRFSIRLLLGRPVQAFLGLIPPNTLELLDELAVVVGAVVKEELGFGELERGVALLAGEVALALRALDHTVEQHGADAGAMLLLRQLWLRAPMLLPGGALIFDDSAQDVAWNLAGLALLGQLAAGEAALRLWPVSGPVALNLISFLIPGLIVSGLSVLALSVLGDAQYWVLQPIAAPDDTVDLIEGGFWREAFEHLDPSVRLSLAMRIDALNTLLNGPHPPANPNAPCVQPSNRAAGAYAAISYEPYEQVVLERLNGAGDFRLSIAGLDPTKPGAPNNLAAVMLTADFPPQQNHYYQHVRERLFAALEQIPPGSRLHLQGHSMGGAMALLLRDDPEVQRRLSEAEITVPSLTIYGAVAPAHADLRAVLTGGPFADSDLRVYVNPDDALALNVGADYAGFAQVYPVGEAALDAPHHAHGDYQNPDHYAALPPELQLLPYVVDPGSYERVVPQPRHALRPLP